MNTPQQRQKGLLLLPVAVLLLSLSAWLLLPGLLSPIRNTWLDETQTRLAIAKAALIARAVIDINRPGTLPCPDRLTNDAGLKNFPDDGKADNLTRNDCPSYLGWLPWATLDLPELTDASGARLWYALSRNHRDDESAQPVNPDTPATLSLDGQADIVALVIAPGAAGPGQNRPSALATDYLDAVNSDEDNNFSSGPDTADGDRILPITRHELMAAVSQAQANAVRTCLRQHIAASTDGSLPWPAGLTDTQGRGEPGRLFGRLPQTQSGISLQQQASTAIAQLANARLGLNSTDAQEQLASLNSLSDQLPLISSLADMTFVSAQNLALKARSALNQTNTFHGNVSSAVSNGRISRTERTTLTNASSALLNLLDELNVQLGELGLDPFREKLRLLNESLGNSTRQFRDSASAQTLTAANTALSELRDWLSLAHSDNTQLANQLSVTVNQVQVSEIEITDLSAAGIGTDTQAAIIDHLDAARVASQQFANALNGLYSPLSPSDVQALADDLLRAGNADNPELLAAVQNTLNHLSRQTSLAPEITSSQSRLNSMLDTLVSGLLADQRDNTLLTSTIELLNTYASQIRQLDDNLTRSTLRAFIAALRDSESAFLATASLTQAAQVPYVNNMDTIGQDIGRWLGMIDAQASALSLTARRAPGSSRSADSTGSAYARANQALASIHGSNGSLQKLEDYLAAPTKAGRAAAAESAVLATRIALDTLSTTLATLLPQSAGTQANALPMYWKATACAFQQTGSDTPGDWFQNNWPAHIYFQIGHRFSARANRLTVDAKKSLPFVVIASASSIGGQNRPALSISDLFEGDNADPGRDGDARSPSTHFRRYPLDPLHNDRLAHP